jgi:hypothetical protein
MEGTAQATGTEAAEATSTEQTTGQTAQATETTTQDWRASLDPAIKDHAALKSFKTYGDLAKSHVELQKLVGVDKIPVPQNFENPEVRAKFENEVFDRLGRPKDPKEYKLVNPDGVDLKLAQDAEEGLRTQAHKLGLLPHQLDGLYKWYMADTANRLKQQQESVTKKIQDVTAELKSEWGAAFDAKKSVAEKVLDKFATPEERAHLVETGFNNDPKIIRMLAKIGSSISDDSFVKGEVEATMTPKEASAELARVRNQLMGMEQSNPEYKILLQRRNELMAMATPE